MTALRQLPPTWLMGLGFLPQGVNGAILLVTVPQLLAANHVPEIHIATITATGLLPNVGSFILGPLLDWRFTRRAYAIVLTIVGALCTFGALLAIDDLPLLTLLLFVANLAISMTIASVGGWFGNVVDAERQGRLSAWLTAANAGTFGLTAAAAMHLLRGLPYVLGAGILSGFILLAVPLFWVVYCPPADRGLAREGFRRFVIDVLAVLKNPSVQWSLVLFMLPVSSFALTNTLGAFGRDFGTSEHMVGLLGGAGASIMGVAGSLLIPRFERLASPRSLYLLVGASGAMFTLSLVTLPHHMITFGTATLGENLFQGAALSLQNLIILRTIGRDNPLAATQFGLLTAATFLPLTYMQMADGAAYHLWNGVNASYVVDALVSGSFCLLLGAVWTLYACKNAGRRAGSRAGPGTA